MAESKECTKCKITKFLSYFGKNKNNPDGYRDICKECRRKYEKRPNYSTKSIITKRYIAKDPFRYLANGCYTNNKKRGYVEEVNVDAEYLRYLYTVQKGKCYWSGMEMSISNIGYKRLDSVSVDRLDCSIGYIKENVVLTTKFMNIGRGDSSIVDFKEFLNILLK